MIAHEGYGSLGYGSLTYGFADESEARSAGGADVQQHAGRELLFNSLF